MQDIREKLIDLLAGYSLDTYEDVQYVADELIANDVVPVVRCKDCRHYDGDRCEHDRHSHQEFAVWAYDDDFCSYGERKEADGK